MCSVPLLYLRAPNTVELLMLDRLCTSQRVKCWVGSEIVKEWMGGSEIVKE